MKFYNAILALSAFALVACGGNKSKDAQKEADDTTDMDGIETVVDDTDYDSVDDEVEPVQMMGATEEEGEGEEATTEEVASTTNSADIDATLDKYENLMDKYVSIVKKAKNGDISAMSDMAQYANDLQNLYNDLEKVQKDMTPAQAARIAKIYGKMANAAL